MHTDDGRLPEARLDADAARADRTRRRQATDLHVGRKSDAEVAPFRARLLLLAPERVEVEVLQQLVERAVVVARVVRDAHRDVRREVLLRDEVLPPHLERIEAELVRGLVDHDLERVRRLRPPGAPYGVG